MSQPTGGAGGRDQFLYDLAFRTGELGLADDLEILELYDKAMFDWTEGGRRHELYRLFARVEDKYGIDFERYFDWRAYHDFMSPEIGAA